MHTVYILQSEKNKSYYTGYTTQLKERLRQHNHHEAKYTSKNTPYTLVWFCAFKNKQKALEFEHYLKSSSGFAFRNKRLI
ncbi:MAG: GIY-YIG nuclease family protein [Patescibacteria group bacterium]